MVVVSSARLEWQWAGRDEYWKIDNYQKRTKDELRHTLRNRGRSAPVSWRKKVLVRVASRSARGLLHYENCVVPELRSFCAQRKLAVSHLYRVRKEQLMEILEEADENMGFERLLDLPPELRVLIYGFYFDSLPKLREPVQPPLSQVSRLLRQESLPVFYSTCTFKLSDLFNPIPANKGNFFDALNEGYLRTIRNVSIEYYDGGPKKLLWNKGEATVKLTTWRDGWTDDRRQRARPVAGYLETVRTRPEGNSLLKADIPKLRELVMSG